MTETVKTAFVSFVFCSVVGGMLEYLTSQKYRKTLRVAVVGVILALCIMPVFDKDFGFDFELKTDMQNEQVTYDALMHTANLVEKKIRSQIKDILINEGVDEYEIYVTTSVDKEDNIVFLEDVVVEVDKRFEDKIPDITKNLPGEYKNIVRTGVKNE